MSYSKLSHTLLIWGNLYTSYDTKIIFSFREKKNQRRQWRFSWVIHDRKEFTSNDNRFKLEYCVYSYSANTSDPWATRVWIASVHLHRLFFFFNKHLYCFQSSVGSSQMPRAGCMHYLCQSTEGTRASVNVGTHRGPRATPLWILRDNLVLEESKLDVGFWLCRAQQS